MQPYEPMPVPDALNPEVRRFLDEELARIALMVNDANDGRMYGGLSQSTSQALNVTGTPQRLPFNTVEPSRGVIPDAANDEFTVTQGGVYLLNFSTNFAVTNQVVLTFELYVNGLPSGRTLAAVEADTAIGSGSVGAQSLETADGGSVLSLYVSCNPDRNVTFNNTQFFVTRL